MHQSILRPPQPFRRRTGGGRKKLGANFSSRRRYLSICVHLRLSAVNMNVPGRLAEVEVMNADSQKDETQPADDSSTARLFRSAQVAAHEREINRAVQAIISDVGEAPLSVDADQVIRVGRTRVTLDTVVAAFLDGATAEEISQDYSSPELADVYLVLGFYLRHKTIVDDYIEQRNRFGDAMEKEIRCSQRKGSLRERLLDRLRSQRA